MDLKLLDKKVFVTGSTKGIGLAIAQKFQEYGCHVAINSRKEVSIEKAKNLFVKEVYGIVADMSIEDQSKQAIKNFIDKYGSLDILICNVGSGKSAPPFKEKLKDWESSFSKNLLTATNTISASVDYLEKTSGVITCISSICGQKMIENAPLTYSSIKASLESYVQNSSFYLASRKIRINAISPGNVLFQGSIWEKKLLQDPKLIRDMLEKKVPLKKFVSVDDISEAVAFISSPLSSSTTGQIISIDAGQTIA